YFYADFGTGRLWSISWQPNSSGGATVTGTIDHTSEVGNVAGVQSFATDLNGELYLVFFTRIVKVISTAPAPAAAPTNLTSQTSGRTVTLNWTGVAGAAQYRLEAGSRSGASDLASFNTGSTQASYVASSVPDGVYYVRVRAVTGTTTSAASNEVVVTVGASACTGPPPAPAGLAATGS